AWLRARRGEVVVTAFLLVAVVFVLDLSIPEYPFAAFYLVPLVLVAFVLRERLASLLAALCLVLTVTVMLAQGRTGIVELMLVLAGSVAAIGLIAFARLQRQVELISRRAVQRAELAEATAGIIELSDGRADVDDLVRYTVEHVGTQVGAASGVLLLLSEGEWAGLGGYGQRIDPREMRFAYESFAPGVAALESDEPVRVVDDVDDARVGSGHHQGQLLVVPLRAFGRDLGVIVLDRPSAAEALTRDQLRFVTAVAGHAAVAIDNSRLLSELEARRHDLSLVVESSLAFSSTLDLAGVLQAVVERLVDVLQVHECSIYVIEGRGESLRRVASLGSSSPQSIGETFRVADYNMTREAVAMGQVNIAGISDPHLSSAERAVMAADGHSTQLTVPLKVRDKVIGIVELYDDREARLFTQEDADLASAIAQSAALAIDNARLFGTERDTTHRLQLLTTQLRALQDVTLAVNQLVDPQAILNKVVTAGSRLLDAPHGAVVSREGRAIRLQAAAGESDGGGVAGEPSLEDRWLVRLPALLNATPAAAATGASLSAGGRLLVVPLAPGRLGPSGSLVFARDVGQAGFNEEDMALATTLGAHLSAGLERAIAYQRDHEFAGTFLDALLVTPPVVPGLDAAVRCEWASDLHHGGDFYDFVTLREGRLMVVIGDLCGKGEHQQAVIAKLRYMLRAYAAEGSPGESLSRLNAALLAQEMEEMPLTTLIAGYLDFPTRLFEFAVAGHPRPFILGGRDEVPCGKSGSYPVGIFPTVYETNRVILPPEATVVLYTDGFTDARGEKGFFGERRLLRAVRSSLDKPAKAITVDLIERVHRFTRSPLRDDVAVVVLKLR
ncbi:MAG TPA: SpoIIE family protein phosphatase, partial [Thermoleophilia bacterium]|nr:SpoIIE family protein phosphatase [Thermoleophilia bacterium]